MFIVVKFIIIMITLPPECLKSGTVNLDGELLQRIRNCARK